MRPNLIGWFLVAFFFLGGLVFFITIPEIWIGQIWMAVAVFLGVLYAAMTAKANNAATLAAHGTRGQAQILNMTQTGTYINNQPRVKLRLRIEAPGITPFEDEDTVTVPLIALGALSAGGTLSVVLDPAEPQKYVIDWFGNAGGPPITFQTEDGRSVSLANDPRATAEVVQILQKHGLEMSTGLNLRERPEVRAEVLAALQRSGLLGSASGVPGASAGGVAAGVSVDHQEDPATRLATLNGLLASGQITLSEFEEHKKRILSDI